MQNVLCFFGALQFFISTFRTTTCNTTHHHLMMAFDIKTKKKVYGKMLKFLIKNE